MNTTQQHELKKTVHGCKSCGNVKTVMAPQDAFDVVFIICDNCK